MHAVDIFLKHTLSGHQNPIFAVENGVLETSFYTGGNDKGVVEWDILSGKFKRILCAVPASVYALHRIVGTSLLAIGMRNGEVWLVDTETQTLEKKFKVDRGAVFSLQAIAEKQELIAVGEEGMAYIWSLENGELLYRFRITDTTIRTLALYPDQQQVVFGDKEGRLHLYAVADYQLLTKSAVHTMPVTALLATDTALYSGGRDAQLYQLGRQGLHVEQNLTPHMFTVYDILQYPGSNLLITVSRDKAIKFWDKSNLSLLKNVSQEKGFDSHRLSINAACIHSLSQQLITVSDDKLVKVWDVVVD
ncbi:WD40 repeat domain-containing protein [Sphingobacterium wenxiniae]|uniref:WD domain-containing protein, G-beta repeat-containing protein n=1 Tax=Sphingobacterium wenxiniae TaxID=683125 RepID=A0A1I6U1N9_9SPHI|nr:hypothetical protein [Sphingobacterium wenxiniae]SFS95342.1 WD domain-containing protein, G-beta repeat-containing protein [Sphingobacterium wenxiniae]